MATLDERVCGEFLAACHRGDREAQRAALERLAPSLRKYVVNLAMRWRARNAMVDPEDVAQHVLEQLTKRPPSGQLQKSSVATLLAWCKTTANRYIVTSARRQKPIEVSSEREQLVRNLEAEVENQSVAAAIVEMLDACYPDGLEVLIPDASDDELARRLGIALHVVQKRRSRAKKYAQVFRILEERPDASALEVTVAMGAPNDAEHRGIVERVRLWLRQRRMRRG